MTEDTMIDKITKLLNKAERAGTPEEAETFAAKASELMMKHSIDEAMLAARRPGQSAKIIEHRIAVSGSYWQAHRELAFAIGNSFGFKLMQMNVQGRGTKGYAYWIGFEDDIKIAEMLYLSLMIQGTRALRTYQQTIPEYYTGMERFKARRSFLLSFARIIGVRLHEQRKNAATEADKASTSGPSTALVLASRHDQVSKWYEDKHADARPSRGGNLSGMSHGSQAGREAGMRADLGNKNVQGARGELR